MRIYISGKITGNPNYKEQFAKAEEMLKAEGYKVFNPCCIPNIFSWEEFMDIDMTALGHCDVIYMLKGWEYSKGAKIEHNYADNFGIRIIYEDKE